MFRNLLKLCLRTIILIAPFSILGNEPVKWEQVLYDDATVAKLITVITTTSPLQSMPRTRHIYYAQKSLGQIPALAQCKKIIVFDDIAPTSSFIFRKKDYELYKRNIRKLTETNPYFSNTDLIFCSKWGCLVGALKEAFKQVTTPFVFIHQHDLVLIKPFDLNASIATMVANPSIRYIALLPHQNGDPKFLPYWTHVDDKIEGIHFVPLCRAGGWIDQSHIAKTSYYKEFILPRCPHAYMESHIIHQYRADIEQNGFEKAHDRFGIYLYGGLSDGSYIRHTDGKNR